MAFATITCIWRECKPDVPSPHLTALGYEAHWQYQSVIVPQVWVGPIIHTQSLTQSCARTLVSSAIWYQEIKSSMTQFEDCFVSCQQQLVMFQSSLSLCWCLLLSPWPLVTPLSLKSPLPVVMHLCCNPLSLADFDVHVHTQSFTICSKTVLQTQNTFESGLQSAALIYVYRR